MEDIYDYTEEELKKLGDAIVWTAILGAVHQDGVIQASERAVAIKQAHIRTFSTENYIKPIYKHLEEHFERDFDAYSLTVTGTQEEKEALISSKIEEALSILPSIGPLFTQKFSEDLKSLYNKVFNADSNVFQFFAFPVISSHLEKFGIK